jgi:hypothetical protein
MDTRPPSPDMHRLRHLVLPLALARLLKAIYHIVLEDKPLARRLSAETMLRVSTARVGLGGTL